jgi:hypothetical protein
MPITHIEAFDELVQVGALQPVGLERDMLFGAQVIEQQLTVLGRFLGRLRSKSNIFVCTA